jgi:hypothetical protein
MLKMLLMGLLVSLLCGLLTTGACLVLGKETLAAASRAAHAAAEHRIRLNQQFPFQAPPNGQMDAVRVERFLAIRGAAAQDMGATQSGLPPLEIETVLAPLTSLRSTLDHQMKNRVQLMIKSLESNKMGPAEYVWQIRSLYGTVFADAASGAARADTDALAKRVESMLPLASGKMSHWLGQLNIRERLGKGARQNVEALKVIAKRGDELFKPELVALDLLGMGLMETTPAAGQRP